KRDCHLVVSVHLAALVHLEYLANSNHAEFFKLDCPERAKACRAYQEHALLPCQLIHLNWRWRVVLQKDSVHKPNHPYVRICGQPQKITFFCRWPIVCFGKDLFCLFMA